MHALPALTRTIGPATTAVPPPAPPPPSDAERAIAAGMSADAAFTTIEQLAKVPRVGSSPEFDASMAYLKGQLEAAGWNAQVVEEQPAWGKPLRNLVAERAGTAPDGERKLVVAGAHLDSVRNAPGANDNASGSAVLLESARVLAAQPTRNDMRLIWFDREEAGLVGSNAYVRNNTRELQERSVAMLNADMVASPKGDVGFSVGPRTSAAVGDAVRAIAERNGISAVFRAERHSRSDHASFDRIDVPAVDFGVSVRTVNRDDPNYHSPRDTPDKLNKQVLEGYGDLFALTLYDFANRAERIAGPPPPPGVIPDDGPPL